VSVPPARPGAIGCEPLRAAGWEPTARWRRRLIEPAPRAHSGSLHRRPFSAPHPLRPPPLHPHRQRHPLRRFLPPHHFPRQIHFRDPLPVRRRNHHPHRRASRPRPVRQPRPQRLHPPRPHGAHHHRPGWSCRTRASNPPNLAQSYRPEEIARHQVSLLRWQTPDDFPNRDPGLLVNHGVDWELRGRR
jgi:hypothetical protein